MNRLAAPASRERLQVFPRAGGEPLRLAREDVAPPEFEGFDVNET